MSISWGRQLGTLAGRWRGRWRDVGNVGGRDVGGTLAGPCGAIIGGVGLSLVGH